MIISTKQPKCWDHLAKLFNLGAWGDGIIVTYGGVIHSKDTIPPDFLVHELVHVKQQEGIDADLYLAQYLSDAEFRKKSEAAAYRVQATFLEVTISDPKILLEAKEKLCETMVKRYAGGFDYKEAKFILNIHD